MEGTARMLAVASLGFTVLGCSEPAAPGPIRDFLTSRAELALRTDQAAYVASALSDEVRMHQYGFRLIATFENRTRRTLYLGRCYPESPAPIFGVRMEPEGNSAFGPVWACVGHDSQIAVAPGEIRTDTLDIRGPNGWDGRTGAHFGILEGRMRLFYQVQTCRGDGACRAAGFESDPFTVTLEP